MEAMKDRVTAVTLIEISDFYKERAKVQAMLVGLNLDEAIEATKRQIERNNTVDFWTGEPLTKKQIEKRELALELSKLKKAKGWK
jgi:hypothetical protein